MIIFCLRNEIRTVFKLLIQFTSLTKIHKIGPHREGKGFRAVGNQHINKVLLQAAATAATAAAATKNSNR